MITFGRKGRQHDPHCPVFGPSSVLKREFYFFLFRTLKRVNLCEDWVITLFSVLHPFVTDNKTQMLFVCESFLLIFIFLGNEAHKLVAQIVYFI